MPFHRSYLWLVLLSVMLTLVLVLGLDSLGCVTGLNTRRLSDFGRAAGVDSEGLVRLYEDSEKSGCGHVQRVAVDRVSAEQLNVSFVESLVPTLAELSEEAWVNAPVPYGLLYFVEIRTSKLVSLAQLIRADPSLTSENRRRLMQRLVVNYHAVTRVGDKLCGSIDDYVDRVAARTVAATAEGSVDGAECERQPAHHSHDMQDLFLLPQYREALEDAKGAVLEDLVARNPGWREAVRVCRLLNAKMEHFSPIINSLLNDGAASLM